VSVYSGSMKLFLAVFLIAWGATVSAVSQSSEQPSVPYYDWDACPFEGCSYGEWEACATTPIRKNHDKNTPIVFKVKKGTAVRASTGVVITTQPGIVKVLKSITIDEKHPVSLKSGDVFYTLHYEGEGYDLFWYNGELHSAQMEYHNDLPGAVKDTFQLVREPKADWWVQIKNSAGKVGWTNETRNFGIAGCQ